MIYIFDIFGRDKIYQMLKTMGLLSWNGAFYLTIGKCHWEVYIY